MIRLQEIRVCRIGDFRPTSRLAKRMIVFLVAFGVLGTPTCLRKANAQYGAQLPASARPLLNARMAPGAVAGAQAARRPSPIGAFQPLSIRGPEGLQVALAKDGQFLEPLEAPVTTAMMVGAVYRFRVTQIPYRPGSELFPTVEIIDRTYAPRGREHRFPIPVVLTEEDLKSALAGAMVTRVIYLEDSTNASPMTTLDGEQLTRDVSPTDDALKIADQLGRPVAILRIGSRVPSNLNGDLSHFLYGCPPWMPLPAVPDKEKLIREGRWPQSLPVEPAEKPFSEPVSQDYPRAPAG